MIIKHKLEIDFVRPGVIPRQNVMQNDANSRVLEISLLEDGAPWEIPAGVTAALNYIKPDGTTGLYDTLPDGSVAYTISGSTITMTLAPQVLTVPGLIRASIILIQDSVQLNTFPLMILVEANPGAGAEKSENYYHYSTFDALNQAIGNLADLETEDKSSLVAAVNEIALEADSGTVKSINGIEPDANGNVEIDAGEPGFSPTVIVNEVTGGTYVHIRDQEGTKSAFIPNGKDGKSVTVATTIESTEDEGINVVTFTDMKSIAIKNGSKGDKGDKGDSGAAGIKGDPGYTPVKGVDYWTDIDKAEVIADANTSIAEELAKRGQLKPEFANSIEECIDTSKLYVLPDGYIYAYVKTTSTEEVLNYTNQLELAVDTDGTPYNGGTGWKANTRLNSSATESTYTDVEVTGFIPVKMGDIIRFQKIKYTANGSGSTYSGQEYLAFYDAHKCQIDCALIGYSGSMYDTADNSKREVGTFNLLVLDTSELINWDNTANKWSNSENMAYFRISAEEITNDSIITVNEEIKTSTVEKTDYAWTNTGHAFVPANYEDRIIELETTKADHNKRILALENASPNGLPDYAIAEAESVIDRIIAAQGNRTFTFAAITDMHYGNGSYTYEVENACKAMKYIDERIKLDTVAVLGDYTDGYPASGLANAISDFKAINRVLDDLRFAPNLRLQGNHDYYADNAPITHRFIQAYSENVVWGNKNNGYFYKDFDAFKLRIICVNTTEMDNSNISCSVEQYNWFVNSLDLSAKNDVNEWQILILSHHPLDWYTSDSRFIFGRILDAYKSGSNWTTVAGDISCNYVNKNHAKLIGNIHGHIHNLLTAPIFADTGLGSQTNVYRISTPESCIGRENQYDSPWREDTHYPKTAGTAEETSFCVYCIDLDTHTIQAICYGAGYDREISF